MGGWPIGIVSCPDLCSPPAERSAGGEHRSGHETILERGVRAIGMWSWNMERGVTFMQGHCGTWSGVQGHHTLETHKSLATMHAL